MRQICSPDKILLLLLIRMSLSRVNDNDCKDREALPLMVIGKGFERLRLCQRLPRKEYSGHVVARIRNCSPVSLFAVKDDAIGSR